MEAMEPWTGSAAWNGITEENTRRAVPPRVAWLDRAGDSRARSLSTFFA
jgi:hypothetical protein